MPTLARRIADLMLTLAAGVGVLCLVMLLAGLIFDVRPLIFRSGSMAPTITSGSLAIAHEIGVQEVRVGDIVSVPTEDTRVTHRVVEIVPQEGERLVRLQGDANRTPDARPYRVDRLDRVVFSIPVLGAVIGWLSRPPGVFVLAGYLAVLLTLIMKRRPRDPTDPPVGDQGRDHDQLTVDHRGQDAGRGTPARRRAIRAALGAALLGGSVSLIGAPTMAAFTDSVAVSGSTVSAGTVPAPTLSCGALGLLSVRLNWTAVPGATNYTVRYGTNGSQSVTVTATNYTFTAAIAGGTAWVIANRQYGATTWSSTRSNTRTYTVAAVSLCS